MLDERSVGAPKRWTEDEVRVLLAEIVLDLAPTKSAVAPDARLIEDFAYNSLALLELAFSLEDEFHLPTIDEAAARTIITVRDVEQYVLKQLTSSALLVEA
jgi:acyl carrier protein